MAEEKIAKKPLPEVTPVNLLDLGFPAATGMRRLRQRKT
jgi:hypothetical protein